MRIGRSTDSDPAVWICRVCGTMQLFGAFVDVLPRANAREFHEPFSQGDSLSNRWVQLKAPGFLHPNRTFDNESRMQNASHHSSPSSFRADLIGGLTTFLTMAYIVVVNPAILSTEGTGLPFAGVMTATVLLAAGMSMLMGIYAKLPFGVAPGMGLNAFLAFSVILGRQIPWPIAMGLVFWAGVIFLLLSILPVRMAIVAAIPVHLRAAAAMGIGLFLAFIGLKNAGLVVADPVTFVKFGAWTSSSMLAVLGLFIMAVLLQRGWPVAFLLGIFMVTGLAFVLGLVSFPEQLFSTPDFSSTFLNLDIWGALRVE